MTARDDGATFGLLESEAVAFEPVGRRAAGSRAEGRASPGRARNLARFGGRRRVSLVLSASRPASLAARRLGVPAFYIGDYEFSSVAISASRASSFRMWSTRRSSAPAGCGRSASSTAG